MSKKEHTLLLATLHYDPLAGTWSRIAGQGKGKRVGHRRSDGYLMVRFNGKSRRSHALAWLYMTGKWSRKVIDHEDNNNTNDRWTNLRQATNTQNRVNSKCRSDNKTGFKGVHQASKNCFNAIFVHKRKTKHLGCFPTPQEAHAAYCREAKRVHGEFARGA